MLLGNAGNVAASRIYIQQKMLKNKNMAKEASCAGPSRTEEVINSFQAGKPSCSVV